MMRRVMLMVLVGMVCGLSGAGLARAAEPVGTVTSIEGVSDVARGNAAPVFVDERTPVYVNDRIRTKNYSKIEITFADNSVVKLAPGTCVTIGEYTLGDAKKRVMSRIVLTRGKMETVVSKTGNPDTFVIETPNARGAVRGSDIFVSYLGGKSGFFAQEGTLAVSNLSLPDKKINIVKGNCVFVPFDQAPGEVRPFLDSEANYFRISVAPVFVRKALPSKGVAQMNAAVVSFAGTVRIYKKGAQDWRAAKLNDVLAEGDKVQAEADSKAEIRLGNGDTVVVHAFTELIFDSLRFDASAQKYDSKLTMTKGRVSALVETAKDQTFRVQTPVSICGVRGTFMDVTVGPQAGGAGGGQGAGGQGAGDQATHTFFEGGNGYVTSTITGNTQDVGAGQNVVVDQGGVISDLMNTTNEERNSLVEGWTLTQSLGTLSGAGPVASNLSEGTQVSGLSGQGEPQEQGDFAGDVNENLNNMDILSTVTFDQVNPIEQPVVIEPVEAPIEEPFVPLEPPDYTNTLELSGVESAFAGGTLDLVLSNAGDNTWEGTINATYNSSVWGPWEIAFYDELSGDTVLVSNVYSDGGGGIMSVDVGTEGTWYASEGTSLEGAVDAGETTAKNLTLSDISGTYSADGEIGTITGTATGTWEEVPLIN